MPKKLFYYAAAFSVLILHSAKAQNSSMPGAGTRVKLVTPVLGAAQQTGRVVSANADTIEFRADVYPVTRSIPLSQISSMQVSAGQVSGKRRFALIGLAAGGVIGFATGYHATGSRGGQFIGGGKKSASENAFLSAGLVGALGGLTGWLLGRTHVSENWVSVRTEDR